MKYRKKLTKDVKWNGMEWNGMVIFSSEICTKITENNFIIFLVTDFFNIGSSARDMDIL
jgi:hypothetical protein